jgi:hypothetical protein
MMRLWIGAGGLMLGSAALGATQVQTSNIGLRADTGQAVSACLSPAEQRRPVAQIGRAQRLRIIACINASVARQINRQLPVQVDDITRLERLSTSGAVLAYHYRVARRRSELRDGINAALEESTRANVCQEQSMVRTMSMGGSYSYHWVDSDGQPIHQMTVTHC